MPEEETETQEAVTLTEEQFRQLRNDILESSEPSEEEVEERVADKAADERREKVRKRVAGRNPNPDLNIAVGDRRDVDGEGWKMQTFRILDGVARRDYDQVHDAREKLARAGHYGKKTQEAWERGTNDPILTSGEGQPFLPTAVMDRIEDIGKDYGAARQDATIFTFNAGTVKVPNVSGRLTAHAVNEGASIQSKKANFGSVTIDPDKYGVIVPWTSETDEEVGPQVIEKLVDLAGEAFVLLEDQTVFTADGTATYHSLTGLLEDGNINEYVMEGEGADSSFNNVEYDDFSKLKQEVAPTARQRGAYYFHHDIESIVERLKDDQGQYIYGPQSDGVNRIWSRPARTTEALPDLSNDAANKSFAIYGDLSFVIMGFQRQLQSTLLTEATIEEVDNSGATINLAAQDSQAIRFTARWDVVRGLTDPFAKLTTSDEGS